MAQAASGTDYLYARLFVSPRKNVAQCSCDGEVSVFRQCVSPVRFLHCQLPYLGARRLRVAGCGGGSPLGN